jgi:DNA-directed RNA polymerase specialized sigma24 family protein
MDRQHVEQLFRQHYRRMYAVASSLLYDRRQH